MRLLAIESSTSPASLCLADETRILAEATWEQARQRSQELFPALRRALHDAGCTAANLDAFVVGLGPGAFSSLRMALATTQAMALPSNLPVLGIPSAEVLAFELAARYNATDVAVVGNARRDMLWVARFNIASDGLPSLPNGFRLVTAEALGQELQGEPLTASPDWEALAPVLCRALPNPARRVEGRSTPTAHTLARLVRQRIGEKPEAWRHAAQIQPTLSPIYLHPATTAAPRTDKIQ